MPRGKLSDAQKEAMQSARAQAAKDKEAAMDAVISNPQFLNPKFWKNVGSEIADGIVKAIQSSQKAAKLAEIEALEAKAAKLKADLGIE